MITEINILEVIEQPYRKYSVGREKIVEMPQRLKSKLVICGVNGYLGILEKKDIVETEKDYFLSFILNQFFDNLFNYNLKEIDEKKGDNINCLSSYQIKEFFWNEKNYGHRKKKFDEFLMIKFGVIKFDYEHVENILKKIVNQQTRTI